MVEMLVVLIQYTWGFKREMKKHQRPCSKEWNEKYMHSNFSLDFWYSLLIINVKKSSDMTLLWPPAGRISDVVNKARMWPKYPMHHQSTFYCESSVERELTLLCLRSSRSRPPSTFLYSGWHDNQLKPADGNLFLNIFLIISGWFESSLWSPIDVAIKTYFISF